MSEKIYTICNVYKFSDREKQLLPHFINHYRDQLRSEIIFLSPQNNTEFHKYCESEHIEYRTFDTFDALKTFGQQDSSRINSVKDEMDCWYMPVDLDEFVHIKDHDLLLFLQKKCVDTEALYVTGYLIDSVCEINIIKDNIDPYPPIHDQFPVKTHITGNIMGGCVYKVLLASPEISVSEGHHWPIFKQNKKATHLALQNTRFPIYHYKWFGNVFESEYIKYNVRAKYAPEFALEQQKLLDYFDAWPFK